MVPDCNQPLGCRTTVNLPAIHDVIVLGSRRAGMGAACRWAKLDRHTPHIDHGVIAQANVIEQWCAAFDHFGPNVCIHYYNTLISQRI